MIQPRSEKPPTDTQTLHDWAAVGLKIGTLRTRCETTWPIQRLPHTEKHMSARQNFTVFSLPEQSFDQLFLVVLESDLK